MGVRRVYARHAGRGFARGCGLRGTPGKSHRPRGVVASARKSAGGCGAVTGWGPGACCGAAPAGIGGLRDDGAGCPVGCQYSVTAVDLRCIEPASVVISHPCPLPPRASASLKGTREDYHGSMNGQYRDHGPLRARRDGSYGPCLPLERVPCAGLRAAARPLTRLWR